VLLRLVEKLPQFRYDPAQSFRAWLRTVTRHILLDVLAERQRQQGSGDSDIVRLLDNLEAREGLAQEVEAEFDRELLDEALKRVRPRVPPQQWEAFRLTALEGLSGADAGAQLGMLVATVYTAKSKVQQLVREEVRRLEDQPVHG
jgi:RNA polymerase sigma factor (sigma-70 family)